MGQQGLARLHRPECSIGRLVAAANQSHHAWPACLVSANSWRAAWSRNLDSTLVRRARTNRPSPRADGDARLGRRVNAGQYRLRPVLPRASIVTEAPVHERIDQSERAMPHGKVCYLEIPAITAEASADFYRGVFG